MSPVNPLAQSDRRDDDGRALVARAQAGERQALEEIVRRHQAWICNIAIRMLYHPPGRRGRHAGDLIKALTRLSSFEGLFPLAAFASTSAPPASKIWTSSSRPCAAANISGVRPARSAEFGSAPALSSSATSSGSVLRMVAGK